MDRSLTLQGVSVPRILSFISGVGMIVASIMTIDHYFSANFPATIWEGSFCDINAFFNCDSSAFSSISQIGGVPLGYFGAVVGGIGDAGSGFPLPALRTHQQEHRPAQPPRSGCHTSLLFRVHPRESLLALQRLLPVLDSSASSSSGGTGSTGSTPGCSGSGGSPSPTHLGDIRGGDGVRGLRLLLYHDARVDAQTGGVQARIVEQYFGLPEVPLPSTLSPLWSIRSTDAFGDAPIQIVEYGDLLCPDCLFLAQQLHRMEEEFPGKINVIFQPFPLEGLCNDVVEKDLHKGACEMTYFAARDPEKFKEIHDEVWASWPQPRDPDWRQGLAERYGVLDAPQDSATLALVDSLIQTGKEYEKTSDRYSYGIRSTPTMLLNGRMVIGTLPDDQVRAILDAILTRSGEGGRFLENWVQR